MKGTDYFAEELGIQVLEAKDGYAKVSMKVEKKHTNALGFTHGGVVWSWLITLLLMPAISGTTLQSQLK